MDYFGIVVKVKLLLIYLADVTVRMIVLRDVVVVISKKDVDDRVLINGNVVTIVMVLTNLRIKEHIIRHRLL